MGGFFFCLGLFEDEREHAYSIRASHGPRLGELLTGRGGIFARFGGELRQADGILGIVNLDVEGTLGIVPLLFRVDSALEPAVRVESCAGRLGGACLFEVCNRRLWDP